MAAASISSRSSAARPRAAQVAAQLPPPPPAPGRTVCRKLAGKPPPRQPAAPCRAAPSEAAHALIQVTCTPLVTELMQQDTLWAAVHHSACLAALAVAVGVLGSLVLRAATRAQSRRAATPAGGSFNVLAAAAAAALRPCQALLPHACATYLLMLAAALAQVAAMRRPQGFDALCFGHSEAALGALKAATYLLQGTTRLLAILLVVWWLIEFKDKALRWLATCILSDDCGDNDTAVVSTLRPLSSFLNLVLAAGAGAAALAAYGVNLPLLLASLGGLGLVVGIASQDFISKSLAAAALYTARPYNAGDEVHLSFEGNDVLKGTVLQVLPLRTIMRSEQGGLVYVNNSDVARFIVTNMTQGRALAAVKDAPSAAAGAAAAELL